MHSFYWRIIMGILFNAHMLSVCLWLFILLSIYACSRLFGHVIKMKCFSGSNTFKEETWWVRYISGQGNYALLIFLFLKNIGSDLSEFLFKKVLICKMKGWKITCLWTESWKLCKLTNYIWKLWVIWIIGNNCMKWDAWISRVFV